MSKDGSQLVPIGPDRFRSLRIGPNQPSGQVSGTGGRCARSLTFAARPMPAQLPPRVRPYAPAQSNFLFMPQGGDGVEVRRPHGGIKAAGQADQDGHEQGEHDDPGGHPRCQMRCALW